MGMVKEFEHSDPLELKGIEISGGDIEFQAKAMIGEFIAMGTSKEDLIRMFNDPFYAGIYHLTQLLGEDKIIDLINECLEEIYTV